MPPRDEETQRWRAEPEPSAASGGHLSDPSGSLFEALDRPAPSARRDPPAGGDPTQSLSRSDTARSTASRRSSVRRRVALRRVKRTLRHVDPFSVLKLSLFFYACLLVIWLIVVAILYSIVDNVGVFSAVAEFCKDAVIDSCRDQVRLGTVERWAFFLGLIFAIVASIANVVFAFAYNVAADLLGGLELTFVERDPNA